MAKSKLEKVLEHLINNNEKAASALLHEVIIDKARNIHSRLMEDDNRPQFFTEDELEDNSLDADLDDVSNSIDDANDDLEMDKDEQDDEDTDMDSDDDSSEESDFDFSFDELEKELEELEKKFDQFKDSQDTDSDDEDMDMDSDEDDSEDEDIDMDSDDDSDDDFDLESLMAEVESSEDEELEDDDEKEEVEESDFFDELDSILEEELSNISENTLSDLEVVSSKNEHDFIGSKSGGIEKFKPNHSSPIPQKPVDQRRGGRGVEMKGPVHSGFDRETPPKSTQGTGSRSPSNVRKRHFDGMSKMKKDGDSSAKLNSSEGFGAEGKTSPLSNIGKKGNRK